jgi:3-oxoacyl-[acyl-carrier protein] reductase
MRRRRYGRIVNLGSVIGKNGGNPRPWIDPAEQARASNVDPAASVGAIRKAKALERDLGATVWLHHDAEDQQAVPLAPEHHG